MRRFWGIRRRILLLALGPAAVIALLLALYYTLIRLHDLQQSLVDRGTAIARQLAPASEYGLFSGNRAILAGLTTSALAESGVRAVAVRDAAGQVLHRAGPAMEPHAVPEPEGGGVVMVESANRRSLVFVAPVVQSQVRIDDLGELGRREGAAPPVLGSVAVEMSRRALAEKRNEVLVSSLMITGFLLVITAVLALALAGGVTRPILQLTAAVQRLREGHLDTRVSLETGDELETLAAGINRMAAAVEASREGLTRQVEDATRELRETLETVEVQNAELAIAKKEALQASRAKSEFLATMSHELRTPLNGVLGYTNLLLRGELDPGQRERAEIIRRSAESLLGIVNDVLDFSRIEANRLDLRISEVDLRDCVEEVLELLAPRAHDKGLELILHLHSDVPRVVRADPNRLRQILVNLVSNAVKFTEHGSVTVRVQHQGADSDPGLLFTVSDTGVGLSRAQRERLFRSFSQAHDGSAQAEGSGLGLVISRQLAERMQGRLWLESEPGEGTQVRFSIRYEPAAGPAPAGEAPGATGTLLLHEPHASQRLSLRDLLMDLGYQVQDTGSAPGLARLARSGGPFDGVVLSLPAGPLDPEQLDALEAAAPELAGLPGVVLTSELYSRQSLTLPGHPRLEALPKPVRAGRLAAALRRLLTDSAPGAAAALPAPARDELAGIRVLVADDHGVNQRLLATVLAGRGASVEVAGDGREVLRRLSERPCDLVLMDVHMPELDGLAATAMLRSMEAGVKRTPVVGVTADVLGDTREGLLRSGMDDVLTKPVDEEALCRAVRRWVPQPLLTGPGHGGRGEEAAPPVVDDVAAMRSTGGRRDLVGQLRGMLDAELEHALPALAQALGRGDPDAAETAHRIRGGAAHCGAPALAEAAERLEAALRAGSGDARALLGALEAEAERFRRHARGGRGEAQ